jgi:hypothetical protein
MRPSNLIAKLRFHLHLLILVDKDPSVSQSMQRCEVMCRIRKTGNNSTGGSSSKYITWARITDKPAVSCRNRYISLQYEIHNSVFFRTSTSKPSSLVNGKRYMPEI